MNIQTLQANDLNSAINFFQFYPPQPENLVTPKHWEPTGGNMERERERERGGLGLVANKQLLSYLLVNIFTYNFVQLT